MQWYYPPFLLARMYNDPQKSVHLFHFSNNCQNDFLDFPRQSGYSKFKKYMSFPVKFSKDTDITHQKADRFLGHSRLKCNWQKPLTMTVFDYTTKAITDVPNVY